jgi:BirA family transcriptional regulator, biotin operon repressor / biotin---[acetyl-CoA-carboxylase] ligase
MMNFNLSNLRVTVFQFESIGSTNTFLKERAQAIGYENLDSREAICVLADEQTEGRGRMNRSWHSPRGEGLYFSILLKPRLAPRNAPLLTLMAAVATAEAITPFCQASLDIKWPNDILLNGKKAAGILTEASFESERLNYAVLGIGVNLNQSYFPEDIKESATSLYLECGTVIDRERFLFELINHIDVWYVALLNYPEKIIEKWERLSSFAWGKLIRTELEGRKVEARTCGLDNSGALRAEMEGGRTITLYGGEITACDENKG